MVARASRRRRGGAAEDDGEMDGSRGRRRRPEREPLHLGTLARCDRAGARREEEDVQGDRYGARWALVARHGYEQRAEHVEPVLHGAGHDVALEAGWARLWHRFQADVR